MSIRDDRLRAEYDSMKRFRSQVLRWQTMGSNKPPDHYQLHYNLRSIIGFNDAGKPQYHTGFTVAVRFRSDYPRSSPEVRLTEKPWPIHPNIWKDGRFCLEGTQHWNPGIGVSLDSICLMVGEIIAFQEVYVSSPANREPVLSSWIRSCLQIEGRSKVSNPVDSSQIRLADVGDAFRWGSNSAEPTPRIRFG